MAPSLGDGRNFSQTENFPKPKISDDLLLVIDRLLCLFYQSLLSDIPYTCRNIFLSTSYFPTHPVTLLLQILGAQMHGQSPTSNLFGGTVSLVPLSLHPWVDEKIKFLLSGSWTDKMNFA